MQYLPLKEMISRLKWNYLRNQEVYAIIYEYTIY